MNFTSKFLARVTDLPPPIGLWYGLLSLAVIYAFYPLFIYDSRQRHLPPGPRGWPYAFQNLAPIYEKYNGQMLSNPTDASPILPCKSQIK
jgi:hypothetical protein